jgi:hypothetical protein
VTIRDPEAPVFHVPTGASVLEVDLGANLTPLLSDLLSEYTSFYPVGQVDLSGQHALELRSRLNALELSVGSGSFHVGISPVLNPVMAFIPRWMRDIKMDLSAEISRVSMSFSLWDCSQQLAEGCEELAASSVVTDFEKGSVGIGLDLGLISSSLSFLNDTPVFTAIREVMKKGVKDLHKQARRTFLPWEARITHVDLAAGIVTFDKGVDQRISAGEAFEIYAVSPTDKRKNKLLAHIVTTDVSMLTSTAMIKKVYDEQDPQPGDIVMVRVVHPKKV